MGLAQVQATHTHTMELATTGIAHWAMLSSRWGRKTATQSARRSKYVELRTVGQNCGEMLAETGSFDVLFWYWVLGIGYSGIYIHIYVYIYILSIGYWGIYIYVHTSIYWEWRMRWYYMVNHHEKNTWSRPMPNTKYAWWVWRYALIWWCMVGHHETT